MDRLIINRIYRNFYGVALTEDLAITWQLFTVAIGSDGYLWCEDLRILDAVTGVALHSALRFSPKETLASGSPKETRVGWRCPRQCQPYRHG